MLYILLGIFIFCLFLFMILAFFLPEWLGITGKKAKEIMAHQQGDAPSPEAPAPEEAKHRQP